MSKVLMTTALAAVFTATLAAQATQTPAPSPAAASSATANNIVVQGCVEPSVNAVSSTPDALKAGGSVSTATAFILTTDSKDDKPVGTSGSSASAAIAPTYQLSVEDSKLIPHVGHKVEITGTVSNSRSSSAAATSGGGLPPAPTLKVENVKMIAETCDK
jgi:opacity protein-like surface antigen